MTRTPVFRVTVFVLLDPAKTLVPLASPLFGQQRWNLVNMREHLDGSERLCMFVSSFFLCLSQSVFGTIQRRLACPCANVDTHQSRSVVKFCVAQFMQFCVYFLLSYQGRVFCFVAASCGHVSLIVDQIDWQCCRSPLLHSCGAVLDHW